MLIDTHCHLTYPGLLEKQDAVVQQARAAGVTRMITIGTGLEDHQSVLATVRKYPDVFGALGIHPHHAGDLDDAFAPKLERNIWVHPKILAVGECGLDYHGHSGPTDAQQRIFVQQLEIAQRLNKPVILHVRDAHDDALSLMRSFADVPMVVHCFTGTPVECGRWLDRGAYIGITGIVTYKNAPLVREVCRMVPADRLLVETDAPYLSPDPVRKEKINQPAHVAHVAAFVARERGVSPDQLAAVTTENAGRLFGHSLIM